MRTEQQLATALRDALRFIETVPGLHLPADGSIDTEAWWALIEQTAPTPRAADLPDGTVVAAQDRACIKTEADHWRTTAEYVAGDILIDYALRTGARVLRYGYPNGGNE